MSLSFPLTEASKDSKNNLSTFIKANYGAETANKYESFLNQLNTQKLRVSHITHGNKDAIEQLSAYIINTNFVIPKFIWHSMKMDFTWSDPYGKRNWTTCHHMIFDKINCLWNMAAYLSHKATMMYLSFDDARIAEAKDTYSKILGILNETAATQQKASEEGSLPGVTSVLLSQESIRAFIAATKGLILSCEAKLMKNEVSLNKVKILSSASSFFSEATATFTTPKFDAADSKLAGSLYALSLQCMADAYFLLATILFEKSTSNCGAALAWLNKGLEDIKTTNRSLLGNADPRFSEATNSSRAKLVSYQKTLDTENNKIYFCTVNKVSKTLPILDTPIPCDTSLIPISEDLNDPLVELYPLEVLKGERMYNEMINSLFTEQITTKRDANVNESKKRVLLMSLPYCLDGLVDYPESLKNMFIGQNNSKEAEPIGVGIVGSVGALTSSMDRLFNLQDDAQTKLNNCKKLIESISSRDSEMKTKYGSRWNNTNLLRIINTYQSDINNNASAINNASNNCEQIRATLTSNTTILQEFENCESNLVVTAVIPPELKETLTPLITQLCLLADTLADCSGLEADFKTRATSIDIKKKLLENNNDVDFTISKEREQLMAWIRDVAINKVNAIVIETQKLVRAYETFAKAKLAMDKQKDDAARKRQDIINKGNSAFQMLSRDIDAGISFLTNLNQTLDRLQNSAMTLKNSFEKDAAAAEEILSKE